MPPFCKGIILETLQEVFLSGLELGCGVEDDTPVSPPASDPALAIVDQYIADAGLAVDADTRNWAGQVVDVLIESDDDWRWIPARTGFAPTAGTVMPSMSMIGGTYTTVNGSVTNPVWDSDGGLLIADNGRAFLDNSVNRDWVETTVIAAHKPTRTYGDKCVLATMGAAIESYGAVFIGENPSWVGGAVGDLVMGYASGRAEAQYITSTVGDFAGDFHTLRHSFGDSVTPKLFLSGSEVPLSGDIVGYTPYANRAGNAPLYLGERRVSTADANEYSGVLYDFLWGEKLTEDQGERIETLLSNGPVGFLTDQGIQLVDGDGNPLVG